MIAGIRMKIEHIALWAVDLETLKNFYVEYFEAQAGDRYTNPQRDFNSYFLTFTTGARLEIMQMPGIQPLASKSDQQFQTYSHLALAVGSPEAVDRLSERLRDDGYPLLDGPRWTGDGYYECVVLDPENNRVEITI